MPPTITSFQPALFMQILRQPILLYIRMVDESYITAASAIIIIAYASVIHC